MHIEINQINANVYSYYVLSTFLYLHNIYSELQTIDIIYLYLFTRCTTARAAAATTAVVFQRFCSLCCSSISSFSCRSLLAFAWAFPSFSCRFLQTDVNEISQQFSQYSEKVLSIVVWNIVETAAKYR